MPDLADVRRDYWTRLLKILDAKKSRVLMYKRRPLLPVSKHAITFGLDRTHVHLWAGFKFQQSCVDVGLMLQGSSAEDNFRQLGLDRNWSEFEKRLGSLQSKTKPRRFLVMTVKDTDRMDRLNWPEDQRWMVENLERFYDVFKPLVAKL